MRISTRGQAAGPRLIGVVCGLIAFLLTTTGAAPPPVHPTFKSHWPGYGAGRAWDVAVEDDLAYVAVEDGGLLILDVSAPNRPRELGNFRLTGRGPIVVAAPYAYLGANGLQVIDVSNPSQPSRIGGYEGLRLTRLAVAGDYAYAAAEGIGLVVFDLADKTRPIPISTNQTIRALGVVARGDFVYASGIGQFWILNVTDPSQPTEESALNLFPALNLVEDLALYDRYAFLCDETGMKVVDIADPRRPELVGGSITYVASLLAPPRIAIRGAHAYVGALNGLNIVDISNPLAPEKVAEYEIKVADKALYEASETGIQGIHVAGETVYLALEYDGLQIVNVANASKPFIDGNFPTYLDVREVAVSGNYAYALVYPVGIHQFDIGAPETPRLLGTYRYSFAPMLHTSLEAQGSRVYVCDPGQGFSVIDFIDPSQPQLTDRPVGPEGATALTFFLGNDTAFVGTFPGSNAPIDVRAFDLSDPAHPTNTWRWPSAPSADALNCLPDPGFSTYHPGPLFWASDRYLFRLDGDLQVFDRTDPSLPAPVGPALPVGGCFDSLCVDGAQAFVAGSGAVLLDFHDPTAPVRRGTMDTNQVFGIAARGNYAVVTEALSLKVIDVSDPSNPVAVAGYRGNGFRDVALAGNYGVVAQGRGGLTILDLGPALAVEPRIIRQPGAQRTLAGGTCRFEVVAQGTVPLSYQWRFNESDIARATNPTLSLANVQFSQAGRYSVLIRNPAGVTLSSNASLNVDFPPSVAMKSPAPDEIFLAPAEIVLQAEATDRDGTVAQVSFFAGTNLLGRVSTAPFTITWTNVPSGVYTLTVQATDREGASATSSPVRILVTNVPLFQLSRSHYEVNESNGVVAVTVRRNAAEPATVHFATANATARAVAEGGLGNYYAVSGPLTFAAGELSKDVWIQLVNDLVYRGDKTFLARLSQPSAGWFLAEPSEATVTMIDDEPSAATNFFTDVVFPAPAPAERGALRVTLEPPIAAGKWRFPWETSWRESGSLAGGLAPGNYPVEFLPRPGFWKPADTTNVVTAGAIESVTNFYAYAGDTPPVGALSVTIFPVALRTGTNRGRWRLREVSGADWYDGGMVLSNLAAGSYIVEFKAVEGFVTPAPRALAVVAHGSVTYEATYAIEIASPGTGPSELPSFSAITNGLTVGLPYAFNGELVSDVGYGSGFVVRRRTVLTAAHVIFDAVSLSYVSNVRWFFQRHRGEYEPPPQTPRGSITFAGYAASRTNDLLVRGLDPDESSVESQNLDVAALYFFEDAGRGGYGGFLTSDSNNDWLAGPALKMLIGYPVENVPEESRGRMHQVVPDFYTFERVENELYQTSDIKGFSGISGGPLCVQATNSLGQLFFFPAGVYLGGSGLTIVRAIDFDVVNLINQAERSGNAGRNFAGGGIITVLSSRTADGLNPGTLTMLLGPPAALRMGGSWRVSPTNYGEQMDLGSLTNYTNVSATIEIRSTNLTLEIRELPGFISPTNQTVVVSENEKVTLHLAYSVVPPLMVIDRSSGPGIWGTPATTYRLEISPRPWRADDWSSLMTLTLSEGTNWLSNTLPDQAQSAVTNRFYRALWISE